MLYSTSLFFVSVGYEVVAVTTVYKKDKDNKKKNKNKTEGASVNFDLFLGVQQCTGLFS